MRRELLPEQEMAVRGSMHTSADLLRPVHPNDYFDQIYCLNLDRRIEKWDALRSQLSRWGIRAVRFSAVDGGRADIGAEYRALLGRRIRFDRRRQHYAISSPGAFGCLLSHIGILEDARRRQYRRILILEDDACLHKRFLAEFQRVIQLPCDWGLLYLGASQYAWGRLQRYGGSFYYADRSLGTFAVAVDHSLSAKILELLNRKERPADACFSAVQRQCRGRCFVFSPNVVIADVTRSDIRAPREQRSHALRMNWDLRLYDLRAASGPELDLQWESR